MLTILATTAPIFIMILLGFIAVRGKLVPSDTLGGMSKIVMYFTLPALIFSTLARMEYHDVIIPSFLIAYATGSIITFFIGLLISYKILHRPLTESAIKGAGMGISNSAYFAYPVMLLAFQDPPTAAFAMALIIENIIMMPLVFIMLEISSSQRQSLNPRHMFYSIIKRLITNPLILSVIAGVFASGFHIQLPQVMDKVLVMLSGASATLALIILGGSLVGSALRGNIRDVSFVTIGKLILHPAMVAFMFMLIPDMDQNLKLGGILIAAVPMMSIYPIIASQYGFRSLCASILFATTLASFFTIIAILSLMGI